MSLYGNMSLYAFPTVCGQTLRALSRYPSRTAFSWPGGSLSYQRRDRPDRADAERLHAPCACAGIARGVAHRQPGRHLVRRRKRFGYETNLIKTAERISSIVETA